MSHSLRLLADETPAKKNAKTGTSTCGLCYFKVVLILVLYEINVEHANEANRESFVTAQGDLLSDFVDVNYSCAINVNNSDSTGSESSPRKGNINL